jgi:hypothetical protein
MARRSLPMSKRPSFIAAARRQAPAGGLALLAAIRKLAQDSSAALEPMTRARFDGVERIPADAGAAEEQRIYDAIVRLCDGVETDAVLMLRVTALLDRRG